MPGASLANKSPSPGHSIRSKREDVDSRSSMHLPGLVKLSNSNGFTGVLPIELRLHALRRLFSKIADFRRSYNVYESYRIGSFFTQMLGNAESALRSRDQKLDS